MNLRRSRSTSSVATSLVLALALALITAACGSNAGPDDTAAPSTATTQTAPSSTSTTEAAAETTTSTIADIHSIFCRNATEVGFNSLADIQPLDPAAARELRTKLDLIQAGSPKEAKELLLTIRAVTDPYLAAVINGEITTNEQLIEWAGTLEPSTLDATIEAVPAFQAYLAANC